MSKRCTCMEVFGEDPHCPLHGKGTAWDDGNVPCPLCDDPECDMDCDGDYDADQRSTP